MIALQPKSFRSFKHCFILFAMKALIAYIKAIRTIEGFGKTFYLFQQDWAETRKHLDAVGSDELEAIHRDGHCHEALMWYVHHLTEDVKRALSDIPDLQLPLLSRYGRREQCQALREQGQSHAHVCDAYEEQVTCSSCHSNAVPPGHAFLK